MDILLITPDYPPKSGGIGSISYNYAKHSSHSVDILTIGSDSPLRPISDSNVFTVSELNGILGLYNCIKFINKNQNKYDVLYFHHSFQAVSGLTASIPYIIHAHGNELLPVGVFERSYFQVVKQSLRHANGLLANSKWTKQKLPQINIPANRITQIPPGTPSKSCEFNQDALRNEQDVPNDRPILLTVGRLVERKGHDVVLRAIKNLNVEYFICGSGNKKDFLSDLASEFGISDRVHFEGYVSEEQLPKYYLGSDLFVMPSRYLSNKGSVEGFGIVFLEANSYGLPVVGGDTGGVPSAISNGESGLLVEPKADDVSQTIELLLSDNQLYNYLSQNALYWAEKHNWCKISSRMDDYFARVLQYLS